MQDVLTHTRPHTVAAADHPVLDALHLERVESLIEELNTLLEQNESIFDDDTIRHQMTVLEHWVDCYRRHLLPAETFSEVSTSLLADLRGRLKLAADEQQRLEGEGGCPASKEQVERNEKLLKAIRRSEKLIGKIEEFFPIATK